MTACTRRNASEATRINVEVQPSCRGIICKCEYSDCSAEISFSSSQTQTEVTFGSECKVDRISEDLRSRTGPTITRSYPVALESRQTSLVTRVISGTCRSACQRAATDRANSGSSETIRTLA